MATDGLIGMNSKLYRGLTCKRCGSNRPDQQCDFALLRVHQHPKSARRIGMKTKCSGRLWIPVALIFLLNFTWRIGEAWAKTELHFWHAMSGHLNGAVDALAKKFNEKQRDYEVKPLRKGTYPETLMAAYRSKTPPHIVQV